MMPICVKSEIGTLKKVILKRPGMELEYLSPETMAELLFDDIPYLHAAQREHDEFAKILRQNGAEVVYLDDLIVETLVHNADLMSKFIEDIIAQGGDTAMGYHDELIAYFHRLPSVEALVLKAMSGVSYEEICNGRSSLVRLAQPQSRFVINPMPNLYFTRDPFACIGSGVSLNHMNTDIRRRETIFGKYILGFHPDFSGKTPFYYTPEEHFSIEGGDILNLNEHVLAVGISQRTSPEGAELLARHIFADESASVDTVLAFDIPRTRAFMHLDTVFTQVDRDKFTVHPGVLSRLKIFELSKGAKGTVKFKELSGSLDRILASCLCLESVTLLPCGGESRFVSEREQWNDGANTLCLAPGKVVVYERNCVTNKLLEDSGVEIIKMPSSELSRGRGGPHCMSMPLIREEI